MDDLLSRISTLLVAVWYRRWWGMAAAWATTILVIFALSLVVRDRYEASAKVFVDTQTVLKPLMNGLAFQPDVDQQVRMLARTLISRPNIERLLQSPKIGLPQMTPEQREKLIDRLSTEIKVMPSGDANLFAITYRDINPQRARTMVSELVSLFVASGVTDKQRDSEQARQFLDDQIKTYEGKLSEAENRLKDFKIRNFGLTGTSNQDYFTRMANGTDAVNHLKVDLQAAEQSRDALKHELDEENPNLPPEAMSPTGEAPKTDTEIRLDAMHKQLDDLLRRYTDAHPDVIATKRAIASLEQQRAQEIAQARKDGGRSGLGPTSPVFQRIRVSLAEADAKVAALRGQLAAEEAQLADIHTKAGKLPEVEAQLAQLNRDYDVDRKNYEQLVTRRESASLGEQIDLTTKVAEFRVVEPPRVSQAPVKPSRFMVAVAGLFLSLGVGVAVAYGMNMLVPTVQDTATLREICGRPVLGSISRLVTPEAAEQDHRGARHFMMAGGLLLAVNIVWCWVVHSNILT